MLKIENTDVYGWEAAVRGMRNPMNSWSKSDSILKVPEDCEIIIGDNDLQLMKNLANAGSDHGKFMRMITVTCDVIAPLYWWKEADTYKVGTVANSCSTMHKIQAKEFTLDDFSCEHLIADCIHHMEITIDMLNQCREVYNNWDSIDKSKITANVKCKKDVWWQMIQILPSSYNQRRTLLMNYEVLRNMYHARKNHKLDEWHDFCHWIETLPYSELITGNED